MIKPSGKKSGSAVLAVMGSWYQDADFTVAVSGAGRPGLTPAQLAMVSVLQFIENLTDRQALMRCGAS